MRDDGGSTALAAPRDASLVSAASAAQAGDGSTQGDGHAGPSSDVLPARNPSFRPGALIAEKYVVERLIGEGGLGVVVAARHVQLDQMVAIKYLRPRALASPAVAERFVREARLAAKIRSEHVARVYDVGTLPSGAPYIVMEYLSGMDLGRVLSATGPMPAWRAVEYVLQACSALGAAHAAGIVHRDIKPENLFVTTAPNGTPLLKVLDFGISKMTSPRTPVGQAGDGGQGGETFGTPVYMAPEQLAASGDVDVRTDVWAIGVVLYQLLAARLPFDGDSLPELCTAITTRRPHPLDEVRRDIPDGLRRAIGTCLAKAAKDRFQTVADLECVLAPFAAATREQRLDQALRTIDAVDRGRPATPVPGELLTRALRAAPVPDFPEERWAGTTTSSGISSWAPPSGPSIPQPVQRHRARTLALLAAGAGAALLAVLVATAGGRSGEKAPGDQAPGQAQPATGVGTPATLAEAPVAAPPPASPPAPAQAAVAPAVRVAQPASPGPAQALAPAPGAARHSSRPARATDEAAPTPATPRAARAPAAPASPASAPSPASARPALDPNSVLDPFN